MKIAIGMVVRNLLSASPLTEFLDNAEKYGHPIDRVIVAYSHQLAPEAAAVLQSRTKLSLIRLQEFGRTYLILKAIGVPYASLRELLGGMAMAADITSSDYSGYNILPPARFDGMTELLWGLHKEAMAEFWQSSMATGGMLLQEGDAGKPTPTTKVLGGNLGLRMRTFPTLPPFFSPYYFFDRTPLLARGEDTLLGLAADQYHIKCVDIRTPIFHDTYGSYPAVPELLKGGAVRDRLYYACTGWIGRNVFSRWKTGHTASEFAQRDQQLSAGAKALCRYTKDRRFLRLPEIQSAAESWLPDMIRQYQRSREAWTEFTERWYGR